MEVLLSIKPEYSEKIFSGEKKFEFRRRRPKSHVDRVFVYESNPLKAIVGWFSVRAIHSGSPEEIWEKCKEGSGIDKNRFFAYCTGINIIYAFEIKEIVKFKNTRDPYKLFSGFKPPQSFVYVSESYILRIMKTHTAILCGDNSDSERKDVTKPLISFDEANKPCNNQSTSPGVLSNLAFCKKDPMQTKFL